MIEIYSTSPKREEKTKIRGKKKTHGVASARESFTSSLESNIRFKIEGSLEELMEDLAEQEKKFLEKQDLFELAKYRALVQHILKVSVDEGFRTSVLKRGRSDKSDFLIIQKINEKIDEIQRKITNAAAFNLLKEIDEIRGLILDLLY